MEEEVPKDSRPKRIVDELYDVVERLNRMLDILRDLRDYSPMHEHVWFVLGHAINEIHKAVLDLSDIAGEIKSTCVMSKNHRERFRKRKRKS